VSVFLLSSTIGNSFVTEVPFEKTASSDSIDSFPQAGKFYTLADRSVNWESVGGENVTSGHDEEILKYSIQDVVGDVALVNRTWIIAYIRPQTGENYTDTYDFDYEIATNRTILSAHQKYMRFDTTGFQGASEDLLDEDEGEHTWAWFPTNLYIGATVNVSWTWDKNFLGDMLYNVTGEQVIEILGEKQDCWTLHMPPSVTTDGTQERTETYWVDKDTGIPLKLYSKGWALDESFGFESEYVLVNTNIDLGPESTKPQSPTYTLIVPTTPGFPEAGKFYTWYVHGEGWYVSGATNVTYYYEGLLSQWVINVTDDEAMVYNIYWGDNLCNAEGIEELESVDVYYRVYSIDVTTREILDVIGTLYGVNMTSLTYVGPLNLTSLLLADIGEETYCWFPTDLYIGATVNITWPRDMPSGLDNATYTVTNEKIMSVFGEPQTSWVLYLPPKPSIDGTWSYTDTYYSDKDVGIPLYEFCKGEAVNGGSAYVETISLIDTNVYLGPSTYVFQAVADSQTFNITVVTNSTIPTQTFNFSQGEKKISFNVTGLSGTPGFCNITIPRTMVDCTNLDEWIIFANGTDISSICIKNRDTDYTYIYIPYNHSVQPIVVKGTWVVPEFPTAIIMPLFMIATLLAVIVYKRKQE